MNDKLRLIRERNDVVRRSLHRVHLIISEGVCALPDEVQAHALLALTRYENFTPQSDPSGEHASGTFEVDRYRFAWSIEPVQVSYDFEGAPPAPSPNIVPPALILKLEGEDVPTEFVFE